MLYRFIFKILKELAETQIDLEIEEQIKQCEKEMRKKG